MQDEQDQESTGDDTLVDCGADDLGSSTSTLDKQKDRLDVTESESKSKGKLPETHPDDLSNYDPLREWLAKSLEIDLASLRLADDAEDEEDPREEVPQKPAGTNVVPTRTKKGRRLEMKQLKPFLGQSGLDVEKGFILVDGPASRGKDAGALESEEEPESKDGQIKATKSSPSISPSRLSVFLPALDSPEKSNAGESAVELESEEEEEDDEDEEESPQAKASVADSAKPEYPRTRARAQSLLTAGAAAPDVVANPVEAESAIAPPTASARISSSSDALGGNEANAGVRSGSGARRRTFLTTTKAAEAEDAGAKLKRRVMKGRAFVELEFTFSGARLAHIL